MRGWVITTSRGEVYFTVSKSKSEALATFERKYMGLTVSSIVEAIEF